MYVGKVPPAPAYCQNRFTDGYNWTDYFALTYDVPLLNYAVGGSGIHQYEPSTYSDNVLYSISKSLFEQVKTFEDDLKVGKVVFDPEDTVYVLSGGNDFLIYSDLADAEVMAQDVGRIIRRIRDLGYHKVHVGNLPYLPYTPYINMTDKDTSTLKARIEKYNKFLEVVVEGLNLFYQDEIGLPEAKFNKYHTRIFNMYQVLKDVEKYYDELEHMFTPCYLGSISSFAGLITYFNTPFKVRSEAEEEDYYNYFLKYFKNEDPKKTLDANFKKKFYNTRCPSSHIHLYTFYDDVHPTSHVARVLASKFDAFIRDAGMDLPPQKEMIEVYTCINEEEKDAARKKQEKEREEAEKAQKKEEELKAKELERQRKAQEKEKLDAEKAKKKEEELKAKELERQRKAKEKEDAANKNKDKEKSMEKDYDKDNDNDKDKDIDSNRDGDDNDISQKPEIEIIIENPILRNFRRNFQLSKSKKLIYDS